MVFPGQNKQTRPGKAAEEAGSLCTISYELKIDRNDATRMLKFIEKSIQVCDESGEAPTLNKFSWMLAGQCQFANCTAVEAKRVLLICKLAELPNYPSIQTATEIRNFMIYLQKLILTLDEKPCVTLSSAKKLKSRQTKPKRKKKTAGTLKSKDQIQVLDLRSTERQTPKEVSPAVQLEPELAIDKSGGGIQTTQKPAPIKRIKVVKISLYPPKVAPRAVNPEVFALASRTPLPFDNEFGSDILPPLDMSPPPST